MSPSPSEIERDVALGRSAHANLLACVRSGGIDGAAPSRLPGWNRAQVLTHLARNADGHRRMIEGAARGEVLEQYEGGVEGRDAGIAAGASRTMEEAVDDFAAASAALERAWSVTDWLGSGRRTLAGPSPIGRLPFLRTREVSLHGVDLDIGIELADLDPRYVRLDVARLERHLTSMPTAVRVLALTDQLGWLTGRRDIDGVDPAGIF